MTTRLTKSDLLDGARCARRLWLLHQSPVQGMKASGADDVGVYQGRIDQAWVRHSGEDVYG